MDQMILDKAKLEIEAEAKKKEVLKAKTLATKAVMDK